MPTVILVGDVMERLADLADESVHCVVTSPPYWGLRDYGVAGQIGLEPTLAEHLDVMVGVFRAVRRVLRKDGVCWVNYGDCYATTPNGRSAAATKAAGGDDRTFRDKPFSTVQGKMKPKDLCLVPERLAIALQDDGWYVRAKMPWIKRSAMPESIKDRPAVAHETVFLLTRAERYFYDATAVRQAAAWNPDDTKFPDGWNTAEGGHGSVHPEGREKGKRTKRNSFQRDGSKRTAAHPGQTMGTHRPDRDDIDYGGADRNWRSIDLFLSSLEKPHGMVSLADGTPVALDVTPKGFKDAHFATFPPALVEPMIRAGTSEKGVCPACGAPWARVVETTYRNNTTTDGRPSKGNNAKKAGGLVMKYEERTCRHDTTTGWRPTCGCGAGAPVPATVLDPFGGAGTTALVADRLRRDAVIIELNPAYADIARKRIEADAPMTAAVRVAAAVDAPKQAGAGS